MKYRREEKEKELSKLLYFGTKWLYYDKEIIPSTHTTPLKNDNFYTTLLYVQKKYQYWTLR